MSDLPHNSGSHEGGTPTIAAGSRSVRGLFAADADPALAERALRLFASVVENSADFIGIAALDGRGLFLNSAGRRLVGLADDEDIGTRQIPDFFVGEDREFIVNEFLPRLLRKGQDAVEVRFRHFQTGDEIWVDFAAFTVADPETGEVGALVTITRDISERKWQEAEHRRRDSQRDRLLEEHRSRAEREALLNRIGAAVRTSLDPEEILLAAVSALGEGLRADRCYFVRYDQVKNTGRVFPEWIRAGLGLQPLAGRTRPMSGYAVNRDPAFRQGRTHVASDTTGFTPEDAAPLLALNVRSLLRVPITYGDQMTALGIAMGFHSREWTEDEIRLVENAAALIRAALESAHVQQRERNIARQLQEALLPPAPASLPGLDLASFYRPALDEAGVGGDFFDVYTVTPGRTALVVADLRGKGLQAASQVAMLRNMLRHALYTGGGLGEAVGVLNRILFEHNLIQGFATVFVGIYEEGRRSLNYVNCGQEPGLLWRRRSGRCEQLDSSGPVIGCFVGARFEEREVRFEAGDILALFTDGLTEVGADRRKLLGVEGVARLIGEAAADPATAGDPGSVVNRLIAGVDVHGQGGTGDDIALLVGVAGG